MAKYTGADCRICRREGQKLFLKGERCTTKKCAMDRRPVPPGQHGLSRKKVNEYGLQLREKQKVKRAYGLLEKQFRGYYDMATVQKGVTGDVMLALIEKRLDNVVYRMGIGGSRAQAKQIVTHGHILVNGKPVNIASYQVKVNDTLSIKDSKKDNAIFKELKGAKIVMPKWLNFDTESFVGKILSEPQRDDIDLNIKESLIVELYSK